MEVNNLKLINFRNFTKQAFDFNRANIIIGPNASGKSSILEALHLLSTTKSVRAEYDKEMISINKEIARIDASIKKSGEDTKLEMRIVASDSFNNVARKSVKINGVVKALNNFAGTLNSVIFTPTDLEIITDGPSVRRKFLDSIFYQTSNEYRRAHSNLTKVTKQRNKLLEKINEEGRGESELPFWNEALINESKIIHGARNRFFDFSKEKLLAYGNKLNKSQADLTSHYKPSLVTKERLEEYKEREVASKNTLIGPNRDDFSILLDDMDLESFGSRGQQRMAVLALKLCEIDFIENEVRERPILLLDDIFSELDPAHKDQVFGIIDLQQVIITTTDINPIKKMVGNFKTLELDTKY